SSDRRNLHLPGGVADQKYASRSDAALNRRPPLIHRNARSLEPKWREPALFHEAIEAAARFLAVFTDQTQSRALARFRDQPVKVGRVVWHEPDTHCVRRHVRRQPDDGLDQGNGWLARPPGSLCNAGERAVGADDNVGVQLFSAGVTGALDANAQTASVALQRYKSIAERNLCAMALRLLGKAADQSRALNDQVRAVQWNLGGAAVGKEFKFADFVNDGALPHFAQQRAHVTGDDQRAGRGIQMLGPLDNFHRAARSRQKRRGKKTCSGAADDSDL